MIRNDRKALLIGGIINSVFWLVYAVIVLSYVGIITESILILSNIFQLTRIKINLEN